MKPMYLPAVENSPAPGPYARVVEQMRGSGLRIPQILHLFMIAEGTGKMRQLRDTVILMEALCDSSYYAFGGCPRGDFLYWREIWLRRVQ